MRVAEYRNLSDELAQWLNDAHGAVGDAEQERAAYLVLEKIEALKTAYCPRATERDRVRAARLI